MIVDLHTHTIVSSRCSVLAPEELVEEAARRGLDAVWVTDHFSIRGAEVTQRLGDKVGLPVFRGVDARTDHGDVLVFGYYRDIAEGIPLGKLCRVVHGVRGLVYAAHPFHMGGGPSLARWFRGQGWHLSEDWDRLEILGELDGIETLNGQVGSEANARAERLARRLSLPGIGGSDAHAVRGVGRAVTRFAQPIRSDGGLVAALRHGDYVPLRLRN